MDRSCRRCGAPLEDQKAFCASCGAPQIRVSVPEASSAPPEQAVAPVFAPGTPGDLQPPAIPVRLVDHPIAWKRFLIVGLPLAVLTGFVSLFLFPLGLLVLLPASVAMAIHWYRRTQPLVKVREARRMGLLLGLLSWIFFALPASISVALDPQEVRDALTHAATQTAARSPDQQTRELLQALAGSNGMLIAMVGFTLLLFLLLFLLAGWVTGWIVARSRHNEGRML